VFLKRKQTFPSQGERKGTPDQHQRDRGRPGERQLDDGERRGGERELHGENCGRDRGEDERRGFARRYRRGRVAGARGIGDDRRSRRATGGVAGRACLGTGRPAGGPASGCASGTSGEA